MSSRRVVRRAVGKYSDELRAFSTSVTEGVAQLKRATDMKPCAGAVEFRQVLEDLEDEMSDLAVQMGTVAKFTVDSISLEELLGHSLALYHRNRRLSRQLQTHLATTGWQPPPQLKEADEPEDPLLLAAPPESVARHDSDDEDDADQWRRGGRSTVARAVDKPRHEDEGHVASTPYFAMSPPTALSQKVQQRSARYAGSPPPPRRESSDNDIGSDASTPVSEHMGCSLRGHTARLDTSALVTLAAGMASAPRYAPQTTSSAAHVTPVPLPTVTAVPPPPRVSLDSHASSTPDAFFLSPSLALLQQKYRVTEDILVDDRPLVAAASGSAGVHDLHLELGSLKLDDAQPLANTGARPAGQLQQQQSRPTLELFEPHLLPSSVAASHLLPAPPATAATAIPAASHQWAAATVTAMSQQQQLQPRSTTPIMTPEEKRAHNRKLASKFANLETTWRQSEASPGRLMRASYNGGPSFGALFAAATEGERARAMSPRQQHRYAEAHAAGLILRNPTGGALMSPRGVVVGGVGAASLQLSRPLVPPASHHQVCASTPTPDTISFTPPMMTAGGGPSSRLAPAAWPFTGVTPPAVAGAEVERSAAGEVTPVGAVVAAMAAADGRVLNAQTPMTASGRLMSPDTSQLISRVFAGGGLPDHMRPKAIAFGAPEPSPEAAVRPTSKPYAAPVGGQQPAVRSPPQAAAVVKVLLAPNTQPAGQASSQQAGQPSQLVGQPAYLAGQSQQQQPLVGQQLFRSLTLQEGGRGMPSSGAVQCKAGDVASPARDVSRGRDAGMRASQLVSHQLSHQSRGTAAAVSAESPASNSTPTRRRTTAGRDHTTLPVRQSATATARPSTPGRSSFSTTSNRPTTPGRQQAGLPARSITPGRPSTAGAGGTPTRLGATTRHLASPGPRTRSAAATAAAAAAALPPPQGAAAGGRSVGGSRGSDDQVVGAGGGDGSRSNGGSGGSGGVFREVTADEYADLPAFCKAQMSLEVLARAAALLHAGVTARSGGAELGFSDHDMEALGFSGSRLKALLNNLIKLRRAQYCTNATSQYQYRLL